MKDLKIKKEEFERIKKVLIANYILTFENVELLNEYLVSEVLNYKKIKHDSYELVSNLQYNKCLKIIKKIDNTNSTIFKIIKK